MVRALGAMLMLVTFTTAAHAEEPPAASVEAGKSSCGAQAQVVDAAAEERAFSAELERFAQRRVFTERLMAKREAEAFERAAQREARAAALKRELTEREMAIAQRQFDEAVALYLKKRELTRSLTAAASRAKAAVPPAPAVAPSQ
jgi:hypothetical protein